MKKRLLAMLLAVCMVIACAPAVSAAETVRETDFFTDQPHGDVNYKDMKYEEMDSETFEADAEAIRALLGDRANAAWVYGSLVTICMMSDTTDCGCVRIR